MSVSVLNDNQGFDLSLCPKIHLKGTLNLQGNFTFKNNCAFLVQLLSVYVMVSLDGNTSYFYSRVSGLHVQRMSSSRTGISVIKCKMLLRIIAEVERGRILLEEKESSQDQVSKKMPCKKLILCHSSFCLASHF